MKRYILFFLFINLSSFMNCSGPSSLDTSFNQNGSAILYENSGVNQSNDIAVQPDGKIISVGFTGDNALISRFNNDGTLDITFNSNGQQSGEPGTVVILLQSPSVANAVALEPITNKIIIAGSARPTNGPSMAFIARYNPDGSPDVRFNPSSNTGEVLTTFAAQSELFDVKIDANGNIVVAGWATYQGYTNALVARYTNAGILDTTFGTDNRGYTLSLVGTVFTKARALTLLPNGNISIVGQAEIDNNQQLTVISYNTTGTLLDSYTPLSETTFSTSIGLNLALQPDGKIVIVGSVNPQDLPYFENQLYTVIRLNSNGALDTNFNATGQNPGCITSDVGLQATGVAIQSNGQIVTCGFNYTKNYVVLVIRYNSDGSIDPTFNFAITQTVSNSIGSSVVIQNDGKILVSGTIRTPAPQS